MTLQTEVPSGALVAPEGIGSSIQQDELSQESRGWTLRAEDGRAKAQAIAALANLEAPAPIASVSYVSHGNLLIVAGAEESAARHCAEKLAGDLHVTLLSPVPAKPSPVFARWTGRVESIQGFLGEFAATIAHLSIEGEAPRERAQAKFDLVLDFSPTPLFAMRAPPQGYFRGPAGEPELARLIEELRTSVGEFEKPRYFAYRENLCAHSRSKITGCNRCIEICSTQAIDSAGDKVKVDPHLCMGCGACATTCPTGAMSYQFPRPADRGAQMKQLLAAYRQAGGEAACLLFHDGGAGYDLLAASAAQGRGIPGRVLPVESWHVASTGLDLLLPAIAFGASQVAILCAGQSDPEYLRLLREQVALGEEILAALGYEGRHFIVIEATDGEGLSGALEALAPAATVSSPATFMLSNDKRTAIEFALEHLAKLAPTPREQIALSPGAPYGEVIVDAGKCTMCMACAGACPASALMDGGDAPMLKFLERNCVQCGLCEKTCPEDAIRLEPRILLLPAVREARVLNETQPFHCVSCRKPFGTQQMVGAMLQRLAGHSMFADAAAQRRLQMCADCRIVDMMSSKNEASILK